MTRDEPATPDWRDVDDEASERRPPLTRTDDVPVDEGHRADGGPLDSDEDRDREGPVPDGDRPVGYENDERGPDAGGGVARAW